MADTIATDGHKGGRESQKGLVDKLLDRLETWARGGELVGLPPCEADRLAHDIGLNVEELRRLAQAEPDAPRLLYARLGQLGFGMDEIEKAGAGARRDMERSCALCGERALCQHDLAERPESPEWRRHCPNSGVFDVMEALRQNGKDKTR